MKFLRYRTATGLGLAVDDGEAYVGLTDAHSAYPGDLGALIEKGVDALADAGERLRREGEVVSPDHVQVLSPVVPAKVICVGLNYADHAAEAKMELPAFPILFSRFASSLVGPNDPIDLPAVSSSLDYEGELAVIIGKRGRYIRQAAALDHVAGYAVFNDATIRDYQQRTTQMFIGKNFDGSGPFGPVIVTPEELPPGASGLRIETRLNGEVMQRSSTDQLIFDVAALIAAASEAMTLEPGDVIITGTPAGVGAAHTPPRFMTAGDVCEVEIERIGTLRNEVKSHA